jgi:hypothetical protein
MRNCEGETVLPLVLRSVRLHMAKINEIRDTACGPEASKKSRKKFLGAKHLVLTAKKHYKLPMILPRESIL